MYHMLVRNKVKDFAVWKSVFDSHTKAHKEAGLRLIHFWQDAEDENNVFFVFEVADLKRAKAFVNAPEEAEAGDQSGVLEFELHFLKVA